MKLFSTCSIGILLVCGTHIVSAKTEASFQFAPPRTAVQTQVKISTTSQSTPQDATQVKNTTTSEDSQKDIQLGIIDSIESKILALTPQFVFDWGYAVDQWRQNKAYYFTSLARSSPLDNNVHLPTGVTVKGETPPERTFFDQFYSIIGFFFGHFYFFYAVCIGGIFLIVRIILNWFNL